MKTKFNRFALLPVVCSDCHNYVWLEPYRKMEIIRDISPCCSPFLKVKICNKCISNYNIGHKNNP